MRCVRDASDDDPRPQPGRIEEAGLALPPGLRLRPQRVQSLGGTRGISLDEIESALDLRKRGHTGPDAQMPRCPDPRSLLAPTFVRRRTHDIQTPRRPLLRYPMRRAQRECQCQAFTVQSDRFVQCTAGLQSDVALELQAEFEKREGAYISGLEFQEEGAAVFNFGEVTGKQAVELYNEYVTCIDPERVRLKALENAPRALSIDAVSRIAVSSIAPPGDDPLALDIVVQQCDEVHNRDYLCAI